MTFTYNILYQDTVEKILIDILTRLIFFKLKIINAIKYKKEKASTYIYVEAFSFLGHLNLPKMER